MVIAGRRTEDHCLRREIRIGSKSHFVSGDWENSLEISSIVTAVKDENLGGVKWGGIRGEVHG